jgi:flagellar basal-body rod modification protein FlgD
MAVENVVTQSSTGVDGNAFTTSVSNDQLTSEDFLMLMLEEMKMQDPTKPMDSQQLMDSQLKMSTIESNVEMADAMKSLQQSYAASALSSAANMIGHIVEDGSVNDRGMLKSYKVETVENKDGELYLNAKEITGIKDSLINTETESLVLYDSDGYIYENDTKTNYRVQLDHEGRFTYNDSGTLKIIDENGDVVTDEAILSKYIPGQSGFTYADASSLIPISNVKEVR